MWTVCRHLYFLKTKPTSQPEILPVNLGTLFWSLPTSDIQIPRWNPRKCPVILYFKAGCLNYYWDILGFGNPLRHQILYLRNFKDLNFNTVFIALYSALIWSAAHL